MKGKHILHTELDGCLDCHILVESAMGSASRVLNRIDSENAHVALVA